MGAQIRDAKLKGGKISVVGAGHSATPAVCANGEKVTILNLASYSMSEDQNSPTPDFQVDESGPTVMVNAGWNIDELMSKLGDLYPDYIMEAQTAGRIFTVGGLINMCTHGGCMKAGLVADTVVGLRVINAEGEVCVVDDEDKLRYYRMSMGAFGVVTHVTMRLRKITELALVSREDDLVMTREFFQEYFGDKTSKDGPLFQQLFFDFHRMKIRYGAWKESGIKRTQKNYKAFLDSRGGSRGIGGAPLLPLLDEALDAMDFNYRTSDAAVKALTHVSVETSALAWRLNLDGENDAFWVSSLPVDMPASIWTAYMVPVDLPSTENIFKAVKVAYDRFLVAEEAFQKGAGTYRPDVALEARFVWSSSSYFAPAFSENLHSQLYFVVEQPTLNSNLYVSPEQMIAHGDDAGRMRKLNDQFTRYFADLEEGWRSIHPLAKPHLAKLFGWAPSRSDPDLLEAFNESFCNTILDPTRKQKIVAKLDKADPLGLFRNKYVQALVGKPALPVVLGANHAPEKAA